MRVRKKPVIVEAVRFHLAEYADNPYQVFDEYPEWLLAAFNDKTIEPIFLTEDYWYLVVKTLEGDHTASPGDWIIRGVKGELYPIKHPIFTLTYETIEETRKSSVKGFDNLRDNGYSWDKQVRKEVTHMNSDLEQQMQDLRTKKVSTGLTPEEQVVLDTLLALDEDQEDVDKATAAVAAAQAAVDTSALQALDNAKQDLVVKQTALANDVAAYQAAQAALTPVTPAVTPEAGVPTPAEGAPDTGSEPTV